MSLYRLRKYIRISSPYFETSAELISRHFESYESISAFFRKNLASAFTTDHVRRDYLNELRKRIFFGKIDEIEGAVDGFNKLKFKIQEVGENQTEDTSLLGLEKIISDLSAFFVRHLEICKYRTDNFQENDIIDFVLQIEQISNAWDYAISRFLADSKTVNDQTEDNAGSTLSVICKLPDGSEITNTLINALTEISDLVFDLTDVFSGSKDKKLIPGVTSMICGSGYMNVSYFLPSTEKAGIAASLFSFLDQDNIASPSLISHALETSRVKTKAAITPATLKNRSKKLIGVLQKLPKQSFFEVETQIDSHRLNSVSRICAAIEKNRRQVNLPNETAALNSENASVSGKPTVIPDKVFEIQPEKEAGKTHTFSFEQPRDTKPTLGGSSAEPSASAVGENRMPPKSAPKVPSEEPKPTPKPPLSNQKPVDEEPYDTKRLMSFFTS